MRDQPQLSLDWIESSVPYQTPGALGLALLWAVASGG
jgi:hypothetical protein